MYSKFDSLDSFIEEAGITDEIWKKEFRPYYDNVTTKSYTHISKQTLSPKQQVDSGVAPHDVICRNGLFLVERSTNEIACTHETTAQKMGWSCNISTNTNPGRNKCFIPRYTQFK